MVDSDLKRVFEYKETICSIISDNEVAIEAAISSIKHHRKQLDRFVQVNPHFLYSLEPIRVSEGPEVAVLMSKAAEEANVGPMAAVAGVLADLAVNEMVLTGAEVAVVENGGEAFAVSNRPVTLALSAGDSPLSKRIGFRLTNFPVGVATSSGLFSHALSLGEAESVTIFAVNAGLADAAATAVGNVVKGKNHRNIVKLGLQKGLSIPGVSGVFIVYRNVVGQAGQIPQVISVTTNK